MTGLGRAVILYIDKNVFISYYIIVIERDIKESSLRRFGRRTRPSKIKEKFTEKLITPHFVGLFYRGIYGKIYLFII